MAVKIRLRRVGRKKQPSYRMVVTESEHPRGGAYLDTVGYYNPQRSPAELQIDLSKVDEWLGRGATMSETTESLVRKARRGGDKKVSVAGMPTGPAPKAETAAAEHKATEAVRVDPTKTDTVVYPQVPETREPVDVPEPLAAAETDASEEPSA